MFFFFKFKYSFNRPFNSEVEVGVCRTLGLTRELIDDNDGAGVVEVVFVVGSISEITLDVDGVLIVIGSISEVNLGVDGVIVIIGFISVVVLDVDGVKPNTSSYDNVYTKRKCFYFYQYIITELNTGTAKPLSC